MRVVVKSSNNVVNSRMHILLLVTGYIQYPDTSCATIWSTEQIHYGRQSAFLSEVVSY